MTYLFDSFELDDQSFCLMQFGERVPLEPKSLRVLLLLVQSEGRLLEKESILGAVWKDTFVEETTLTRAIALLRKQLGDDPRRPKFIETVPTLGYRFIAKVEVRTPGVAAPPAAPPERIIFPPAIPEAPPVSARRIRIAVLPIEDRGSPAEDYFAMGLTEDMIALLSRMDAGRLRVVASPRLRPDEDEEAGFERLQRDLNLDYLLKAWIRRSPDSIRICAQLHDLCDKSLLWSEIFDRKSADLLVVQNEVTQRVSRSLAIELLPASTPGGAIRYSRNPAAYDAYLKGRYFWHKMTGDGMQKSLSYFSEAIAIDPRFAPAYTGLADCYSQMGSIRLGLIKPIDAYAHARTQLGRAQAIDDTLVETHSTSGLLKVWYELDWEGGEREFRRALALDPNHLTALLWQSPFLGALGRHSEAIASVQKALDSEPLSPVVNGYMGMALTNAGRHDQAVHQLRLAVELDPFYYRSYMFLGRALERVGEFVESTAAYRQALRLNPENPEALAYLGSALASNGDRSGALEIMEQVKASESRWEPALLIANIYAGLGDTSEAFRWLQIAYERRCSPLYLLRIDSKFMRFESDPRYQSFVKQIGLPLGPSLT